MFLTTYSNVCIQYLSCLYWISIIPLKSIANLPHLFQYHFQDESSDAVFVHVVATSLPSQFNSGCRGRIPPSLDGWRKGILRKFQICIQPGNQVQLKVIGNLPRILPVSFHAFTRLFYNDCLCMHSRSPTIELTINSHFNLLIYQITFLEV